MAAQWFCLIGQQQYGPFTSQQIQQLVQQGQLQRDHFVRTETDHQWTAAGDLPGLFPSPQVELNPLPPSSGSVEPKKKSRTPPASGPAMPAPVPVARAAKPAVAAGPPEGGTTNVTVPVARAARPVVAAGPPQGGTANVAVPVARAVQPVATAAPAGPPQARPVAVARPIALTPVVPPAPPGGGARGPGGEEGPARTRAGRKNSRLVAGGLTAVLVLSFVVAAVVMVRGPRKAPDEQAGRTSAPFQDPGGDPEIEMASTTGRESGDREIADPVPGPTKDVADSASKPKMTGFPPVSRWLNATRQKGGLREIVRLGVGNVWRESADGKPDVLNVEVQITNLSRTAPLDFSGWRPDVQSNPQWQAVMADDAENVLAATPPHTGPKRSGSRRRIEPGQTETEQLSFLMAKRDSRLFRLALPYAPVGQTGYMGFELPIEMIRDPSAEEEVAPTQEPPAVAQDKPEPPPAEMPQDSAATAAKPSEPETIDDLRREIERGMGADPAEPTKAPPQGTEPDPMAPMQEPPAS